jgi:hypothetical protein
LEPTALQPAQSLQEQPQREPLALQVLPLVLQEARQAWQVAQQMAPQASQPR